MYKISLKATYNVDHNFIWIGGKIQGLDIFLKFCKHTNLTEHPFRK